MRSSNRDHFLLMEFAGRLADAARAQTLARWETGCPSENKGVGSFDPVTEADREAERAMRALIEAEFPEHGISGEELPDRLSQSRFCWSLDPVDGTRSFICRLPTWVTLIALLEDGVPILGLIDAPSLNERYIGFGSTRTFRSAAGEVLLAASGCARLAEARLSTTDPFLFGAAGSSAFQRVRERARTTRYGHDGYAYARLAAGSLDLVIEAGLKPHDYNALVPVISAAGGVIADWNGGSDFTDGKVIAAATPELLAEAMEAMRG